MDNNIDIDDRYYLLQISDAVAFSKLISKEIPNYFDYYEIYGFSYSELENLFDKFIEYNVIGIFMQFKLMSDMVERKIDLKTLYCFKPLKGKEKKGILLPEKYDYKADRPNREDVIDIIDINIMNNKIDELNNGKIDFDTFLNSL